tara:strand:- start:107 stop:310 length:204 start_codon:yes stop_codon:yes gene_type:complete
MEKNNVIKEKCKYCLHGFIRDVEMADGDTQDVECWYCDGSGYMYYPKDIKKWIPDADSKAFIKGEDY